MAKCGFRIWGFGWRRQGWQAGPFVLKGLRAVRVTRGAKQEMHCATRTYAFRARCETFHFVPKLSETFRFVPFCSARFRSCPGRSGRLRSRDQALRRCFKSMLCPFCSLRSRSLSGVASAKPDSRLKTGNALCCKDLRISGRARNVPILSETFRNFPFRSVSFRPVPGGSGGELVAQECVEVLAEDPLRPAAEKPVNLLAFDV